MSSLFKVTLLFLIKVIMSSTKSYLSLVICDAYHGFVHEFEFVSRLGRTIKNIWYANSQAIGAAPDLSEIRWSDVKAISYKHHAKSSSKSVKNRSHIGPKPIQNGSLWPEIAPSIDLIMFFVALEYHCGDPKWLKDRSQNRDISSIPRDFVFYDRRSQKLQNEVPKQAQNYIFLE